jgi:hypothetical protein
MPISLVNESIHSQLNVPETGKHKQQTLPRIFILQWHNAGELHYEIHSNLR